MESNSQMTKIVAVFIFQKILLDDAGLTYICDTSERLQATVTALNNLVNQVVETQEDSLLKRVLSCYLYLSYNSTYVFLHMQSASAY